MRIFQGHAASPGVARGPWVIVQPTAPAAAGGMIDPARTEEEIRRLTDAMAAAATELETLAEHVAAGGHPDEAAIFLAQAEMARDPMLGSMAMERIRDRHDDGVAAVLGAGAAVGELLLGTGDELFGARAADVADVAARIARRLAGEADEPVPLLSAPAIVVARDLAPSLAATLPRERLLGIALEAGSATAHAAILARAYGIPAVVGVAGLLDALATADSTTPSAESGTALAESPAARAGTAAGAAFPGELAIDGSSGEVVIAPDAAVHARYDQRRAAAGLIAERDVREATLPVITRDGVEVTLLANIGTPAEAARCVTLGARGIGLYRTEFLFMERASAPSEEEQLAAYRSVVVAVAPHPVTIRLLDVGGDKPIPYLPIGAEANPFLGMRALRLAEERPEVFVTQLRAALRAAAAGPVKVMAAMVADATDAATLLQLLARARAELDRAGIPRGEVTPGVMLELPSAVLVAGTYLASLGFASLGTNDLLQYTLGVDRGNPALERYQDPLHPALLRLVCMAVEAASTAGIELSVCGEMAGDPPAALALVGLGVRQLSMVAGSLGAVRRAIRSAQLGSLQAASAAALDDPDASTVRRRFEAVH